MISNIGIGWQLHDRTGCGIYGVNQASELLSCPNYSLHPGQLPDHPLQKEELRTSIHMLDFTWEQETVKLLEVIDEFFT